MVLANTDWSKQGYYTLWSQRLGIPLNLIQEMSLAAVCRQGGGGYIQTSTMHMCIYYASQGADPDLWLSQVDTAFREGTEAFRDVAILETLDCTFRCLAGPTPIWSFLRTEGHRVAGHRLGCEVDE